ncbi:MAG TPA: DUF4136 domain-containing protein [Vicinamibacterales bacterium]
MRPLVILVTTATALTLAGCATRIVSSHVELGADFAQYRTYAWGPADALPTGDARLDNNGIFNDYVQGAIEKELAARRLELTSGEPDLLIHWHTNVARRRDVDTAPRDYDQYGACKGITCHPTITEYEVDTLMIDVIDARSQKLIWRAWARDNISGVIDDQARLRQVVVEAVAEMMKRFPPRGIAPVG